MWLVVALAFVPLMPSGQSLWIDEAYVVPYAKLNSLGEVLERLSNDQGSESLMPLGMVSTWAMAQVFGDSEIGLRAASSFWAAAAIVMVWRIGAFLGFPWLPLLFACHPFLWYYGGEARPYAMVIAMGAGLALGFMIAVGSQEISSRGLAIAAAFGPLLCATHVLGIVPLVVSFVALSFILLNRKWRPTGTDWIAGGSALALLVALGWYYSQGLIRGTENVWHGLWRVEPFTALYSVYELLGFAGFGPGRNELRQLAMSGGASAALKGLIQWSLFGAIILASIYGVTTVRFAKEARHNRSRSVKLTLATAAIVAGSLALAWSISLIIGSPMWGRHVAALLPFVVICIALAANSSASNHMQRKRVLIHALALAYLASSLLLRFGPGHQRDDYRSAARLANLAAYRGEVVWWSAAPLCATYYGVEFCGSPRDRIPDCVFYTANLDPSELAELPRPDIVVVSKPELHDRNGFTRDYVASRSIIEEEGFMAFRVFHVRPPRGTQ